VRIGSGSDLLRADLLVVGGDPLADIALLQHPDKLMAIVKEGQFHKRQI
jgi:imidazolonepropionase-like amidohydrolase